jgi:regulator of sigma E protease
VILHKENFYDFLLTRDEHQTAKYMQCIAPRIPFEIKNITNKNLPIVAGDEIISINEVEIAFFHDLKRELWNNREKIVKIKFLHAGEEKIAAIEIAPDGKLGIEVESLLKPNVKKFPFIESVPLGVMKAYNVVKMNMLGVWGIISGKMSVKENLSGPIGLVKIFTQINDWTFFWHIVAVISLCLGIMNILPIPALDGGHALLILAEMITGKKIKEKYIIKIQKVGLALMLSLVLYCTYNDVIHLF